MKSLKRKTAATLELADGDVYKDAGMKVSRFLMFVLLLSAMLTLYLLSFGFLINFSCFIRASKSTLSWSFRISKCMENICTCIYIIYTRC